MIMLLIGHVVIALAGLVVAGFGLFKPSRKTIKTTYFLTAATIGSGTALVLVTQSNLMQSCVSGLVYLAATLTATAAARYKLSLEYVR